MNYVSIKAFNIPEAWRKTVGTIWSMGDIFKVGYGSEETETKKLALSIEIEHPELRPLAHDKAPTNDRHIGEYAVTYLYANYKADQAYTYGSRMRSPVDQLGQVVAKFGRNLFDRQCTVVIRIPQDLVPQSGIKMEPPCLTMLDFEIEQIGEEFQTIFYLLNIYSYWRSWDAYAGLPENIGGLQLLNETMADDITELTGKDVRSGKQILFSKNCHLYQRQYKLVEALIQSAPDSRRMVNPDGTKKF